MFMLLHPRLGYEYGVASPLKMATGTKYPRARG
jgi:hypothetical protein